MSGKKMYISKPNKSPSFPLPDLPEENWCDFRRDYESGFTLKAIAAKYICDPRTVRRCIMLNKSSSELGKQTAPTKLAPYHARIDALYTAYIRDRRGTTEYTAESSVSARITNPSDIESRPVPSPGSQALTPERTGICQISQTITQNLREHGYTGSERTVRNYLISKYQYIRHAQTCPTPEERKSNVTD